MLTGHQKGIIMRKISDIYNYFMTWRKVPMMLEGLSSQYLEYTIDGGSKSPEVCLRIWKTYDPEFQKIFVGKTISEVVHRAYLWLETQI